MGVSLHHGLRMGRGCRLGGLSSKAGAADPEAGWVLGAHLEIKVLWHVVASGEHGLEKAALRSEPC